jgi:hypothetical protein
MLVIGLLLLIVIMAIAIGAVGGGADPVNFYLWDHTVRLTGATSFLVGAAAGAGVIVALWMVSGGARAAYTRRRELIRLRRARRKRLEQARAWAQARRRTAARTGQDSRHQANRRGRAQPARGPHPSGSVR